MFVVSPGKQDRLASEEDHESWQELRESQASSHYCLRPCPKISNAYEHCLWPQVFYQSRMPPSLPNYLTMVTFVFKGGYQTTEAWFVHLLQEKMQVPWRVFANSLAFMPVVRFRCSVHGHGTAHYRGTLQEAMESHHQAGLLRYLELAKSDGRYPPDNLSFGLKDDRSKIPNRPREELNLHILCLSSMCCPEGWQLAKTMPYPDGNWVLVMGKLSLLVT